MYKTRGIKKLVQQIPDSRKEALLREIQAKAFLLGVANKEAYEKTLKHLSREDSK